MPVDVAFTLEAVTIEIFALMEAADESKRRGETPVTIADVVRRARDEAGAKRTW